MNASKQLHFHAMYSNHSVFSVLVNSMSRPDNVPSGMLYLAIMKPDSFPGFIIGGDLIPCRAVNNFKDCLT